MIIDLPVWDKPPTQERLTDENVNMSDAGLTRLSGKLGREDSIWTI